MKKNTLNGIVSLIFLIVLVVATNFSLVGFIVSGLLLWTWWIMDTALEEHDKIVSSLNKKIEKLEKIRE